MSYFMYDTIRDIESHPSKCNSVAELKEEYLYYRKIISELIDDSNFEVMSDASGVNVVDCVGSHIVWYIDKRDNKIKSIKLTTYTHLDEIASPSEINKILNYFARFYKKFYGDVIQMLIIEDREVIYSWKNDDMYARNKKIKLKY